MSWLILLGVDLKGLNDVFVRDVARTLDMKHASISFEPGLASRKATGHVEDGPAETDWCCDGRDFMASGGLHTEALSYARFLQAIAGRRGLDTSSFDAMLAVHTEVPGDSPHATDDGVSGWALGFGVRRLAGGSLLTHGGTNTGFRSGFVLDPATGFGYVFMTNSDRGDDLGDRLAELLLGS